MSVSLKVGDKAPSFELPTDEGLISLETLHGKYVVLYAYPKDDTSGCTKEAIDFSQLKEEFAARNAEVIGISADSATSHAKFRKKHNLSVKLLSDETKKTLEAYGVWVEKSMYGRSYMGVERTTFLISPNGTIERIWQKVKVAGHAEEVLQSLKNGE